MTDNGTPRDQPKPGEKVRYRGGDEHYERCHGLDCPCYREGYRAHQEDMVRGTCEAARVGEAEDA